MRRPLGEVKHSLLGAGSRSLLSDQAGDAGAMRASTLASVQPS
jgi:hypothetical protein